MELGRQEWVVTVLDRRLSNNQFKFELSVNFLILKIEILEFCPFSFEVQIVCFDADSLFSA